jgi:pimeloyl-ACP methyl ester carboxylesterase
MYFTSRGAVAGDLVVGIREVERLEVERRRAWGDGQGKEKEEEKEREKVRVVLIAHSAGAALSQYVLSRGLVKVDAFCLLAGVPGFGSYVFLSFPSSLLFLFTSISPRIPLNVPHVEVLGKVLTVGYTSFSCYKFWAWTAPIHFPYRLFHPRYILANTRQVHDAFFTASTPTSVVQNLERLLSPYESMLWPMQALFRFVTGPDVISSIVGWTSGAAGLRSRFLVLAAEYDVLCTPAILEDAAERYRRGFRELVKRGKIDGLREEDLIKQDERGGDCDGVRFRVVKGLGHHLQNHVEWERGAEEILSWVAGL